MLVMSTLYIQRRLCSFVNRGHTYLDLVFLLFHLMDQNFGITQQQKFNMRIQYLYSKDCENEFYRVMITEHKQACAYKVCTLQVCAYKVCTLQVCAYKVCTLQVCVYKVCTLQVCAYKVCTLQACVYKVCTLTYMRFVITRMPYPCTRIHKAIIIAPEFTTRKLVPHVCSLRENL